MSTDSTARKQTFDMDGVTVDFVFTFKGLKGNESDIKCAVVSGSTLTLLTYETDYSVLINANADGGVVTVEDAEDEGIELLVWRETTNTQESDYEDYNQFPADTVERDFDRRTLKSQELEDDISRAVKASIGSDLTDLDLPLPSAGKALKWNATEDGLENSTDDIDGITSTAGTYATIAQASAAAALVSEIAAATSASLALASEYAAGTYATISQSYSTIAQETVDGKVPYTGATTDLNMGAFGVSFNSADWTGGNVVYVPTGSSIATAITNAVSGDTIQLGAGTYTITSTLAVNKKLHIRGMGRGITTIACATDLASGNMINLTTTDGSMLSCLSVAYSASSITGSPRLSSWEVNGVVKDVDFISTATGASTRVVTAIRLSAAKTVNIYNCSMTGSGATGGHLFVSNPTASAIANIYNCYGISSDGTSASFGNALIYAGNGVNNIYGGAYSSTADTDTGVISSAGGSNNVYGVTVNGSGATGFDVKRTAGTLTLYNTTLVNNKTSGTITYGGTVAGSQINLGGTSLNKTQLDALLALLEE